MNLDGAAAESAALLFLKRQGLTLLKKNFSSKWGEIDIIMLARGTLVFVEVRHRGRGRYGGAAASITGSKQKKLRHTAQLFLQQNPVYQVYPCRFDVIAYDGSNLRAEPTWLTGVF